MGKNTFYITTAIDYVNAEPHIGHAYQKIVADALARWNRLAGKKVFLLTGTDEYGKKIADSAKSSGLPPKEFVDVMSAKFKEAWKKLNIEYERFIRTTDKDHEKTVLEFIEAVNKSGDIYEGKYSGFYCTSCETYYTEKDAPGKTCPIHHKPLEILKEDTFFFRLGKYQKFLLDHYKKNPEFIVPQERKHEIMNRVKEGLSDLSITRTSFNWGIPFPLGKKHIIYVWFDALINYYTAINTKENKKFWPADVHILGKDNGWFHAAIWPAMLKSAGIELPKKVYVHGFLTFNGEKISKSLGNTISPVFLADKYGTDAVRYYCLQVPFGEDGDFSEEMVVEKNNTELADDLGNLLQRTMILLQKNFGGEIPRQGALEDVDRELIKRSEIFDDANKLMQGLEVSRAMGKIWDFIRFCNKYLNETEPWRIKDKERAGTILYNLAECLRIISIYTYPFIPHAADKISRQFGFKMGDFSDIKFKSSTKGKIGTPEILFRKIEQAGPEKEQFGIGKLDLRVAKILSAKEHPNADKLVVLEIDLKTEKRQIVAGIRKFYSIDELKGRKIVVVSNLKPAVLRGFESKGMLLAASKNESLKLLEPKESEPGDAAYFSGVKPHPAREITIDDFKKIKLATKGRKVLSEGKPLRTEKEEIFADIEDGATVK